MLVPSTLVVVRFEAHDMRSTTKQLDGGFSPIRTETGILVTFTRFSFKLNFVPNSVQSFHRTLAHVGLSVLADTSPS